MEADKTVVITMPPATAELMEEAAKEKGVELNELINVIVCEWALRYEQAKIE